MAACGFRDASLCAGVLALEGVGQGNTPEPFPEIFVVLPLDRLEVSEERLLDGSGKDRITILVALAAPNHDLVPGHVNVFDSRPATLHHAWFCVEAATWESEARLERN